MLPAHHLLQLVPNRVQRAIARLQAAIWRPAPGPALRVTATRPTAEHRPLEQMRSAPRHAVASGQAWGRMFDQRWCRIELPRRVRPGTHLCWQDQGEATLHLGGRPYFGFDVAHRHAPLPVSPGPAWLECYCCQSAIWHPDATGLEPSGSRFGGATLLERDDTAWAAYHDLKCLFDLLLDERPRQIPGAAPALNGFGLQANAFRLDPAYRRLLRCLDEAVDALDRSGVAACRERLEVIYREFRTDRPFAQVALTGHAHIDLVWIWPEKMGEAKAVHTFATADRLLAVYPEFKFAYSQPASYRAVERRAPDLMRRIRRHLRSGRWQATGGMDVESDTMLPCGEALARSLIVGQAEFARLGGRASRALWLPDVFGYTGCLPQLCRLAGIDWFFTTKLTWNAINAFPYTSFVWRGTDGTEVLAHVTPEVGYVTSLQVGELQASQRGNQQADVAPEYLLPTGYGDGGGGPTAEMCERARRLDRLQSLPGLAWDQPESFFTRLERRRGKLPIYQGECYLEGHRGTLTSHGRLKAAFRGLERSLQCAEAAACTTGQRPSLEAAWRRLIFAQFHDFIPGSSVPEVYAEGIPELERLQADVLATARTALSARASRRPVAQECLFNPLPLARTVWLQRQNAVVAIELPPLSGVAVDAAAAPSTLVRATRGELSSDRVAVRVNSNGWIEQLAIDGRPLDLGSMAGALLLYADVPATFEAWDVDRSALALGEAVSTPARVTLETNTPIEATLAVQRKVGKGSQSIVRFRVRAGEPVLRIEVELDWHEQHALLKLNIPTGYRGTHVRCGAPFGTVARPQQSIGKASEAMWEMPASRHVTVADDDGAAGASIITEAKYGFLVRDGTIAVSLVRSPRVTGYEDHGISAYRAELSRCPVATPFTDQGRHVIQLAVAGWTPAQRREEHPAALADVLFTPVIPYTGHLLTSVFEGLDGGPSLIPCWAKPESGRGWVLRLHETTGARGQAELRLAAGWQATPVDLLGRTLGPPVNVVSFRPHQIFSLRIAPRRARAGQ